MSENKNNSGPKILLFDIETAPIEAYVWGLFDQNISLEMVKEWTSILSWSAKWLGDPDSKIMYKDNRHKKNIRDDKDLLKPIHKLLNEADIVITQNGVKFDSKKINWRFAIHKMGPTSPYRHIDTLKECRKHFAADSNKLAHLSAMLCPARQKSKHAKFPGNSLWVECLAKNPEAWDEMEKYNPQDIISLEGVYEEIKPWISTINFNVYDENELVNKCNCGNTKLQRRGYGHNNAGKFQKYQCTSCGRWTQSKINLLTKEKKAALRK